MLFQRHVQRKILSSTHLSTNDNNTIEFQQDILKRLLYEQKPCQPHLGRINNDLKVIEVTIIYQWFTIGLCPLQEETFPMFDF